MEFIDLKIDMNGHLLAGVFGSGVWRSVNSTTSVEDFISPMQFQLYQNYPNPFNPNTVISYQLPVNGNVTLKVYDVLGNEIVTLLNEEKPAGSYEVEFIGTGLPSGIYFYQLQTGSYVETKKMILMK